MKDLILIPNLLSLFRLFLAFPMIYFLWNDNLWAVFIISLLGVISDYLDGITARKMHIITEMGKLLDPLADKVVVIAVTLTLYFMNKLPEYFFWVIVLRDVLIFLGGIYITRKSKVIPPSNMLGKVTVNVIAVALVVTIFFDTFIADYLYIIATIFSFLSLIEYAKRLKG